MIRSLAHIVVSLREIILKSRDQTYEHMCCQPRGHRQNGELEPLVSRDFGSKDQVAGWTGRPLRTFGQPILDVGRQIHPSVGLSYVGDGLAEFVGLARRRDAGRGSLPWPLVVDPRQ